jgi:transcriptional regulator with XRE-family HTH domain
MTKTDLRRLRLQLSLTQVALAAELGVQPTTVARWEQGTRTIPPLAVTALTLLARVRGIANPSTSAPPPHFPPRRKATSRDDEPLDVGAAAAFTGLRPSKRVGR